MNKKITPLFRDTSDHDASAITDNNFIYDNFISQGTEIQGLQSINNKFNNLKDENLTLRAELNEIKSQLNNISQSNISNSKIQTRDLIHQSTPVDIQNNKYNYKSSQISIDELENDTKVY